MKPAAFSYVSVKTESELLAALAANEVDHCLLAGGQSLVPMMNFRLTTPQVLIDINAIESMAFLSCENGEISIGALTRYATLEDSPILKQQCPLLSHAVKYVAHRTIRNRGTIGGSLALAYPGAEMPLVCVVLDATVRLRARSGERKVRVEDFVLGGLTTTLATGEYIHSVQAKLPKTTSGYGFVETSRRHGDFAIAVAATLIDLDPQGRVVDVRMGVSGGTSTPVRLRSFEATLHGTRLEPASFSTSIEKALHDVEVFGDQHYPEDYRRHLLRVIALQSLTQAIANCEVRHAH